MATAPDPHRLPPGVTPTRYAITLAPDLDAATFEGTVAIDIEVDDVTDHVVCNAAELTVHEAWVDRDGDRIPATASIDVDNEQVRFDLDQKLPSGPAVLHVAFAGILNDKLRGFYRSTFVDDDGDARTIAVTQFEATDARRAFPCWDEPAHKAVFSVTLEVEDDLLAVSNGPELARDSLGGGRSRITFADTMPMSTYLVAMVVGPLEVTGPVDVDGIPLRIIHRPGQGHLAGFALDIGAFALRYFADYYGIAYPGDKVDMVAVPDFAFGAMENLGCIVYRDALLLIDPETANQSERQAVVDVVAHELAHMWFGDLVTMSWWNGIWLNEAFATFMEMKCCDAYRPEWDRWMHFGRERSAAFDTDALATTRPIEFPVHSPADAEGMFDVLTYQKGSAVVRMLEQYLGEEAFRDGIRRYLQTHQFGNTETGDLWDALEAETGEPVRAMMDSWIFQGGFPLVSVTEGPEGSVRLHQEMFRYLGDADGTTWHVPVVVRSGSGDTSTTSRVVLDGPEVVLPIEGTPVMVNAGGHGFYRSAYEPARYADLLDALATVDPLERYSVLDDSYALLLRGELSSGALTRLLRRLVDIGEEDLSIWQLGADVVHMLDRVVSSDDRAPWADWVTTTISPLWISLGPEVADGDSDRRRALRGLVLGLLGMIGDEEALERSADLFARAVADPASVDPGLASGALSTVAAHGGADTFDAILDRWRHGDTPQEQVRHLYAAATTRDPELFRRFLDLLASGDIRSQNLAFAHRASLRNRVHGPKAWAHMRDHWEEILDRLPSNAVNRLVEGVVVLDDPTVADDVEAFFAGHPVPQAAKHIEQSVERMRVTVALRAREGTRIVAELP